MVVIIKENDVRLRFYDRAVPTAIRGQIFFPLQEKMGEKIYDLDNRGTW